ncbi:60S ribosomal protein L9 [Cichlidogyrus casuarinus]|uniref:Large ribosomal subunit protein uL6 n=1 Tax=Cichlidogyrus casuarinus TaxID=1844966 RepID=A0ABD2Q3T9_9PLAT
MKQIKATEKLTIPKGIKIESRARIVKVTGKRGTLVRSFKHLSIDIQVKGPEVTVTKYFGVKKELAAVKTVVSHIGNMIKGVTYGFRYKMKAAYAHFPINMVIGNEKNSIEIRNYIGQKFDRHLKMSEGVTVSSTGVKDEIQVEGNDVEAVSKSAALIHQSCLIHNKDIRKFLDGIYVSEKTTIEPMEG